MDDETALRLAANIRRLFEVWPSAEILRQGGGRYLIAGDVVLGHSLHAGGRAEIHVADGGREAFHVLVDLAKGTFEELRGGEGGWLAALSVEALRLASQSRPSDAETEELRAGCDLVRAATLRTVTSIGSVPLALRTMAFAVLVGRLAPHTRSTIQCEVDRWRISLTRSPGRIALLVLDRSRPVLSAHLVPTGSVWQVKAVQRERGAWARELAGSCPERIGPPSPDTAMSWWPVRRSRRLVKTGVAAIELWKNEQEDPAPKLEQSSRPSTRRRSR